MTPNIKTIYGLIMLSNNEDAKKIFHKINPEWNLTPFYQRLYTSFEYIINKGLAVDPIEILNYFREHGWNDKRLAFQISNLTQNVQIGSQIYLTSILNEVEHAYQVYKANILSQQIKDLIESENFTQDKYNDLLQNNLISKKKEKESNNNINTIFEVVEDHIKAKNGELSGITLPFRDLEKEVMIECVDVMVIGARPAMGKTVFAITLAINWAFKKNLQIAFFSLEMSKKQIMRRIISNLTAIDSNRIKFGECNDKEIKSIYKVQEQEALNNIHIFEGSHAIKDLIAEVTQLKMNGQIDLIIIDYLQKIIPKTKGSRYEQVTEISNGVKMIAQNMKIPIVALAQLSRSGAMVGKLPTLTDLKESGEIEQDASIVGFLHRPEYYGEELTSNGNTSTNVCEFLIAKNREGSTGKHELGVNLPLSKFFNINAF